MKMIKYVIVAALAGSLGTIYSARAADPTLTHGDDNDTGTLLYRPQELDIDLYGNSALGQQTLEHLSGNRFRHHVLWGGGGGVTLFFLRYVGVGAEYDADWRAHRFVDSTSGNVYLRIPICNTGLAPYLFGGGGYQFEDVGQSFGQAGGGLEYRFCKHLGVFVDGRYIIAERTENYAMARAGLRISF